MTPPGPEPRALSFEANRTKYGLLLLCTLAFVAIGVWMLLDGDLWGGGIVTLFFGAGTLVFIRQMLWRGPRLTIDDEGLHDRTLGVGVIRWDDVQDAWPAEMNGQPFVALVLRDPDVYLDRLGPVRRTLTRANRFVGFPPLSLNLSALKDADAERIAGRIRAEVAARRAG